MSDRTTPGFHHVAIRAVDFDATVKFYTEGLGCTVHYRVFGAWAASTGRLSWMQATAATSKCSAQGSTVQAEGRRRNPGEERTEGALLHFCLRVADVEASYRPRARGRGGVTRAEPRTAALGGEPPAEVRIAFITGPNGEVIEFLKSDQL